MPDELVPMLLYLFVAAACFLTVPVALTVERLVTVTGEATRVAATVERMLNSATNTVFIGTDRQGRITHFNAGAEQTLGYTHAEVLGREPSAVPHRGGDRRGRPSSSACRRPTPTSCSRRCGRANGATGSSAARTARRGWPR